MAFMLYSCDGSPSLTTEYYPAASDFDAAPGTAALLLSGSMCAADGSRIPEYITVSPVNAVGICGAVRIDPEQIWECRTAATPAIGDEVGVTLSGLDITVSGKGFRVVGQTDGRVRIRRILTSASAETQSANTEIGA